MIRASQGRESETKTWTWRLVPSPRLFYLVIHGKDTLSLMHTYTGIPGGRSIKYSKKGSDGCFSSFPDRVPKQTCPCFPFLSCQNIFVYFLLCHCWDTLLKAGRSTCFEMRTNPGSSVNPGNNTQETACLTQGHGFHFSGKWQKIQEL